MDDIEKQTFGYGGSENSNIQVNPGIAKILAKLIAVYSDFRPHRPSSYMSERNRNRKE